MRTAPPLILPIFRSEGQSGLLAAAFLSQQEQSLLDLAQRAGVAYPTAHREVARLLDAGLLVERRVGNTRLVRANDHSPFYRPLRELLETAFGVQALLARHLQPVDGVEGAAIFGSYARRLVGTPGSDPADVDVLVVGRPRPSAVTQACRAVADQVGRPVNPLVLSREEWLDEDDVFVRQLRGGPLLEVVGDVLALARRAEP